MKNNEQDRCISCKTELYGRKRYPVYSQRLAVIGYRCEDCNEKSKSPAAKKREQEMSELTKEVPKLENANMDIRKALKNS
ncbi:Uncharacterised protein [uncultured archaeon]|nr:Uncharacterised protein [uncultured archaeon]